MQKAKLSTLWCMMYHCGVGKFSQHRKGKSLGRDIMKVNNELCYTTGGAGIDGTGIQFQYHSLFLFTVTTVLHVQFVHV